MSRERVGLDRSAVWTDVGAFHDHLGRGELEEALGLCTGELLAGVEEEWVYEYRDAHRDVVSALLERIAAQAESRGDLASAIAYTRKRVALDPLAEDAQRALIVRLAAAGDRPGALLAYGRLRDRLRRELGISPSQQTREHVGRIRDDAAAEETTAGEGPVAQSPAAPGGDGWTPGVPFPLPPRFVQQVPGPFVGRRAEMSILRRLWAEVCAGAGGRMALLSGEAGIGKSRLARELALEAYAEGAVVLHGSADEDLLIPYQHFVEALSHYLAVAAPEEIRRRVELRASDLEPIAVRLQTRADELRPDDGNTETRRYRLFDAVASLLAELSVEAPVLVVLDDLHWADHSSLALLRHTLESRASARLLVVATQRQTETRPGGPLAQALQRLTQQGLLERVQLAGLADREVAELSRVLAGRALAADLVRAIESDTAGNPFFVQEIVRHLSDTDRSGGVLSLARADMPESIREVVNLRLAPLADTCVRLLTVAAVIGAEFEFAPLERTSDLQGEDLAAALDEALAAGLVIEHARRDRERFAFSHALVRRALLERLTRAHRRRIHARVAEALQASRGEHALPEIAYHLCEAVPVASREQALDYAARAAEQATANFAYAEAVDLFTRALSLLPDQDEGRRTLALKRALAYQALTHVMMDTARPEPRGDPAAVSGEAGALQSFTSSGVMSPTIS